MEYINYFLWIMTCIALIGAYLNVKQLRIGFGVWIVSNTGMVIGNLLLGIYPMTLLFLVYLGLSIAGWVSWKNKPEDELAKAAAVIEVAD